MYIMKKIDSWAYPWNLCLWFNNKLVLTPKYNLVKNIGYGNSATTTFLKNKNLIYKTRKLREALCISNKKRG